MTTCNGTDTRLNDYVDGLLPEAECGDLARHLEGCPECRESVVALRFLKEQAAALPRSEEPPRDLWPAIEGALPGRRHGLRWLAWGAPRATPRAWPIGLAAAAALLVVASVSITLWMTGTDPVRNDSSGALMRAPGPALLASYRTAETEYVRATEDLMTVLESRREELSPETVALLEQNLRIIDDAIRLMWTALETDPGYSQNRHLFTTLYQKKITLLQRAIRLPSRS